MNRALWTKAILDAWLTLLGCALLLFGFHWLFVWITSLIKLPDFKDMLDKIPPMFRNLPGISMDELATHAGRLSMAYLDPVVYFVSAAWAISRGSDSVAGELGRGTMEMLLAQPVRRIAVLGTQIAVMVAGAAMLSLAAWLGTCTGLATVNLEAEVSPRLFIPAACNLFSLTVCTAGLSTLASSWDRYRWRAIGVMATFYLVEFVLKVVSRTTESLDWLARFTFHGAYLPQILVTRPESAWQLSWQLDGLLLLLGAAAFTAAAIVFCRRDLPAPL